MPMNMPERDWRDLICLVVAGVFFLFFYVVGALGGDTSRIRSASERFHGQSFSIYVLSRGSGVPEDASTAFNKVRTFLREQQTSLGESMRIREERIGLEGERKLCAEFP